MKIKYVVVFVLILAFVVINFLTPFSPDLVTCFGSVFQADHLGSFPTNVYKTWVQRGIGYRYLLYLIYKFADVFIDTTNLQHFPIAAKLIYYSIFLSIGCIFLRLLKDPLRKIGIKWVDMFIILLVAIFSASGRNISMQAEESAIFLTIGMIAFSLSDNKYLNYLSGLFVPLLLSCKLITVVYVGYPFLILLFLLKWYRRNFLRFVLSCAVFSCFTVPFYIFVIPQEIIDTRNATLLQSSFAIDFGLFYKYFLNIIKEAIPYIPFVSVGIVSSILIIGKRFINTNRILNRNYIRPLFLILLALVILFGVFISSKIPVLIGLILISILILRSALRSKDYLVSIPLIMIVIIASLAFIPNSSPLALLSLLLFLAVILMTNGKDSIFLFLLFLLSPLEVIPQVRCSPYHYTSLIIFSLIAATYFIYIFSNRMHRIIAGISMLAMTFIIWLVSTVIDTGIDLPIISCNPTINCFHHRKVHKAQIQEYKLIDQKFNLSEEPEVLFFSYGDINYVVRSKSYSRYFCMLPLQRAKLFDSVKQTDIYKKTLEECLRYKGRYIFLSGWFYPEKFLFSTSVEYKDDLEKLKLPEGLRNEFDKRNVELGQNVSLKEIEDRKWLLSQRGRLNQHVIKKWRWRLDIHVKEVIPSLVEKFESEYEVVYQKKVPQPHVEYYDIKILRRKL